MFLTRVFRFNKLLFLLMAAFIAAQLFVAYNHGMVFSPFYNYWMYASRFTKSDSLKVVLVYANGCPLKGSDYKEEDWDKIHLTYQYISHPEANDRLYREIRRLTTKAGFEMGPRPFYMPAISKDSLFHLWKEHAGMVSGQKIDSVETSIYYWDGIKLSRR
jgi:hypothetical protein